MGDSRQDNHWDFAREEQQRAKGLKPDGALKGLKTEAQLKQEKITRVYNNTHSVSEVSKLPTDLRFWALEQTSMTYDSGYGERGQTDMCTSQLLNVIWFEDEEALEAWVIKATEERKSYRIFRAEPVKTEVKAVFSLVK